MAGAGTHRQRPRVGESEDGRVERREQYCRATRRPRPGNGPRGGALGTRAGRAIRSPKPTRGSSFLAAGQRGAGAEATAHAAEAAALYRVVGDVRRLPWAVQRLGVEANGAGDFTRAVALLTEALERFRAVGNPLGMANAADMLGIAWYSVGDRTRAAALYRESLTLHRDLADPWETAHTLVHVALLAAEGRDAARAARLLGAADSLFATSGTARIRYLHDIENRAEAAACPRLSRRPTRRRGSPARAVLRASRSGRTDSGRRVRSAAGAGSILSRGGASGLTRASRRYFASW